MFGAAWQPYGSCRRRYHITIESAAGTDTWHTLTLVDRRDETCAQNMNIDVAIDLRESTDLFVILEEPVTFRQEQQLVLRLRP